MKQEQKKILKSNRSADSQEEVPAKSRTEDQEAMITKSDKLLEEIDELIEDEEKDLYEEYLRYLHSYALRELLIDIPCGCF